MANLDVVAGIGPVGALRTTAKCLNALFHLQVFQSQATTQLVDQAQALHLTVQLLDEQLREASDKLESRGTLIAARGPGLGVAGHHCGLQCDASVLEGSAPRPPVGPR